MGVAGSQVETTAPAPEPTVLVAPPRLTESPAMAGSAGMILVPAASGVGAVVLAVTHQDRPLIAVAGLLVLAASIAAGLAMLISSRTGARRRTREQRERYLDYLEQARARARAAATAQGRRAATLHPDPDAAASLAWMPARRWQRDPAEPDFLVLRVGLGAVPLVSAPTVQVDENDPLVAYDPVCLTAAQDLARRYTTLTNQPVCVPLTGVLTVVGPPDRVTAVTRALLAQLIWAHSPVDAAVLICCPGRSAAWDWLKWVPHTAADHGRDGPLPLRLIADGAGPAMELMAAQARPGGPGLRRTVVVIDGLSGGWSADLSGLAAAAKAVGAVALCLMRSGREESLAVDVALVLGADRADGRSPDSGADGVSDPGDAIEWAGGHRTNCRFDELDAAGALLLARSFAPLQVTAARAHPPSASLHPLQLGDVATIDPAVSWRSPPDAELLRVPIGIADGGSALVLDLKESAHGGMGPHGLVVGATGSGKSELLRTLVTTLAITHPPSTLALLLADFKGGATFSSLAELPHLAGIITNLEADLSLVDRFRDALGGELQRRQELLAAAGKLTSVDAYAEFRRRRPELEAMPRLLVVVDEFSELLGARPDLTELFVTIGRIGRSIGIHLLLATQRLDTGRIRGLESHLSYRICLRTFSEAESREAIGSPDAYHLPPEPGSAYLRADSGGLRRFRAATLSRPYRPVMTRVPDALVLPFGPDSGLAARVSALRGRSTDRVDDPVRPAGGDRDRTMLDVAIGRIRLGARDLPAGRPARRVWLDPLPARLALARLLGPPVGGAEAIDAVARGSDPVCGSAAGGSDPVGSAAAGRSRVSAVFGLVDVPERQRQDPLRWDCGEGNGNLLIVGAGRSGKSTAAASLLLSLAHRHSPAEVQVVCLDQGGDTLRPFAALPHVAAVAARADTELTGRVWARLGEILAERETPAGRHRADAAAGRVVLIIDGWAGTGDADLAADGVLDEILRRGPAVGIHTVLTVTSVGALRTRLAAGFGNRIELRLTDSFDSAIDRQLAKALPATIPGRALVTGGHYAQIALPELWPLPGDPVSADPPRAIDHAIATIHRRWTGPAARPIRVLPPQVGLADLLAGPSPTGVPHKRRAASPGLLLGIADGEHDPVRLDLLGDSPHLLVYGDAGAGKTTVLRGLLAQLCRASGAIGPGDVLFVVDYRRGLVGAAGVHRIASGAAEAGAICRAVVAELADRLGGPPGRSWARIHLLVDDYDLVCTGPGHPLSGVIPYLPHGRDLKFHLVVTRRAGGAGRAQYEPLLQTLGDLGTPVLLLSGSPAEGRLAHGLTPRPLPPGRGLLAMRGAVPQLIQTAWVP